MPQYNKNMNNHTEGLRNTSTTSPAIARLVRYYGYYVKECIRDVKPIMPIKEFYKDMLRNKEMNKSRLYEKYLTKLSKKQIDSK